MLIQDVEVGLDPVAVCFGHAGVAVTGVAGRAVGPQPAHTQRQQQAAGACSLDGGVSHYGLEAGIEQRWVHAVGGLLRADRAGQPDLGQHGADCPFRGARGGQTCERWSVLNTDRAEQLPHVGALRAARVLREQGDYVLRRRLVVILDGVQDCGGPPRAYALLVGLHHELDDAGRLHRRHCADRRLLVEQKHLLKPDVADLGCLSDDRASGGQRHLAVGSPRKDSHIIYLMVF